MKITRQEVENIAHLARLKVDDALIDTYAGQISDILRYIDKLKNADVTGVDLVSDAAFNTNVFRSDDARDAAGPEVTLSNAPEREDNFFIVPTTVK